MASTSSMSSPGSTTMASRVVSSPMIEQLHASGPTGRISWIIKQLATSDVPRTRSRKTIAGRRNLLLRRLAIRGWGLHILQHRSSTASARRQHGKRDGGQHKDNRAPGGSFGQHRRGASRSKSGLTAHSAKGGSNIAALSALQQHHNDQEQANDDVNDDE